MYSSSIKSFKKHRLFFIICLFLILKNGQLFSQTESEDLSESIFDKNKYIEYVRGNLPIIISAPHGGKINPKNIPDRTFGFLVSDTNTDQLANKILSSFIIKTKKQPHIIICHLKRTKIDCNREIKEGAQNHPIIEETWNNYHDFIKQAKAAVNKEFKEGLFIDLHGHGHKHNLIELGYLLSDQQLNSESLNENFSKSSLNVLLKNDKFSAMEIINGKASMGALLEQNGYDSMPSPKFNHPDGKEYFSGGFILKTYTKESNESLFGFQLELPYKGVRDNKANQEKFSNILTDSIIEYLHLHTKIKLN